MIWFCAERTDYLSTSLHSILFWHVYIISSHSHIFIQRDRKQEDKQINDHNHKKVMLVMLMWPNEYESVSLQCVLKLDGTIDDKWQWFDDKNAINL